MRTLLIDNYDSFTFNLYQLLAEVNGEPPLVVRHDAAPWEVIRRLPFDNVVISPGPGRPERSEDFGICREAILEAKVPILGVCLGHQGLCHLLGGQVDHADVVMHGRPSEVLHEGCGLFEQVPSPFTVIRYHSLLVTELPDSLVPTARTEDGLLMAVEHRDLPLYGLQFHPESIGTEHGAQILRNFREITERHWERSVRPEEIGDGSVAPEAYRLEAGSECGAQNSEFDVGPMSLRVYFERLERVPNSERAFEALYREARPSFWLDSALVNEVGRFSFMGDVSGPLDTIVSHDEEARLVRVERGELIEEHEETIFEYLRRALRNREVQPHDLPFAFVGGFVGYLGYELEAGSAAQRVSRSQSPDASFLLVHRFVAWDHEADEAFVVCVDKVEHEGRARRWIDETAGRLGRVSSTPKPADHDEPRPVARTLRHPEAAYVERIQRCKEAIRDGESYELCLTNRIEFDARLDPWTTYRALRSTNPAPYAAWLNLEGMQVLSASPERFLSIDASGRIEARPIKGTRPRGDTAEEDRSLAEDLATAEKDRAENLIIVDLLRNDIGRVAKPGSVHVPRMHDVESYTTVHQLVSTVRGELREDLTAVDAIRAAFPGGSMTGAPKRRTLEILDELEGGPRGVYSGALGYFSLDGAADFSIVIRTIVVEGDVVSVGVGGAIVDLSVPEEELREMLLKARGSIEAIERTAERRGSTAGDSLGAPLARRPSLRIGLIDYVNPAPFYWDLEDRLKAQVTFVRGVPSDMNQALLDGRLDVSLVSSYFAAEHTEEFLIVPGVSVAARGAVRSVLLFSWESELCDLAEKRIALTTSSASSIQLLRVLLAERCAAEPVYEAVDPNLEVMLAEYDAALIIGDEALAENIRRRRIKRPDGSEGVPTVFDLPEEWRRLTGKPFVFALWAVRRDAAEAAREAGLGDSLRASLAEGLANLETLSERASRRMGVPVEECRSYLRGLDYGFDAELQGGFAEFVRRAFETGEQRQIRLL